VRPYKPPCPTETRLGPALFEPVVEAHIPAGPDIFHAVPILSVEFVDHVADEMSELGLHVVGDMRAQVAAIESLEGRTWSRSQSVPTEPSPVSAPLLRRSHVVEKEPRQQNLWVSQSGSGRSPRAWYRAISACL
jgi:hypothetical protein